MSVDTLPPDQADDQALFETLTRRERERAAMHRRRYESSEWTWRR